MDDRPAGIGSLPLGGGPEDLDRVFGLTDESGAPVDGSLAALSRLFHEDAVAARPPK